MALDTTPDDTNVPDIHSGALDVAGHVLGSLGVQALSGIKGLSVLPQGADAMAQAVRDYQDKYSPGELSPEGISTIRDTVAPFYRGVQDTFHTKQLGDAYNQGAQSFSDLAGKYLGPKAAGYAGALADVAPMMITPEGLLGRGVATAVEDTAKLVPHTLHMEDAGDAYQPNARSVVARHPETGAEIGRLTMQPRGNVMQSVQTNVAPEAQGQGIGTKLLQRAIDHAHEGGMDFASDTSVTPSAMAPYLKLQQKGYNVSVNPNASEWDSPFGPALRSSDGRPVVSVARPTAPDDAVTGEQQRANVVTNRDGYRNLVDRRIVSTHGDLASAQDAADAVNGGGFADGGEVGTALGGIGKLDHKFATLTKQIQETGGVTYHPGTGTQPTSGYAVSLHKGREQVLPQAPTNMDLAKYTYANRDAFESDPGAHVGVWHDPASGQHFMDVSHVDPDFNSALQKAKANAQLGIFDLGRGETVPTADDTLHFLHMSNLSAPDVTLDPAYYGTGIKGAEAKRGGTKVTSLYPTDVGQVEPGLESKTPYRVSVPASSMYNANEDPLALKDANRLPGGALDMNGYEDAIRDAGYAGYHVPDAEGVLRGQGRLFGPTPATRLGPGPVAEPEEDLSQGFAEGGDVAPVLGDLGSLVAKYAPEAEHLSDVVGDTGGVTYNPTTGDIHSQGYAVPTNPVRSVALDHAPSADDIHDYLLTHQDAFDEDPQASLHVHSDDAGNHFMHVAHVTPDFGAASDVAARSTGYPAFRTCRVRRSSRLTTQQYLRQRIPVLRVPSLIW